MRPSAIQGKGQFFQGGGEALPVMRPLSKFSDPCLHSCCRTEESFTMDEFGAGTLSLCCVPDGAAHGY